MEKSSFSRPRRMLVYLEQSPSVAELNKALVKAAMEFTPIVRDTLCVKMVQGRRVEYRVASLHSLRQATIPALLRHGVFPHQDYCVSNEGVTLVTTLSYGDEFRSSTLPIRQIEDDDRQKGHMTKMRKAGYEAVLFLASEEEGNDEEPAAVPNGGGSHVAAEQPVDQVPAAKMWKMQLDLATKAIAAAKTPAAAIDILDKAKKKSDDGDMDPHHVGVVEELAYKRVAELKKATQAAVRRQEVTA